jgi:hypothetical protein
VGLFGLGLEILDADTNGGQAAEAKEFPSRQIIERFWNCVVHISPFGEKIGSACT